MEVKCATCGEDFIAKRKTARYCSTPCRVRAHRTKPAPLPKVVQIATAKKQAQGKGRGKSPPDEDQPDPTSVEAAVLAELTKGGCIGTVMGQATLVLARRLDHPTLDTGSAVSSLVKQLSATLDAALAGATSVEDPVDELRRRRDEKLGKLGITG